MTNQEIAQKIEITIAGRTFPVLVTDSERRLVEQLIPEVNEQIASLQLTYSNRDKLDCVIMAFLGKIIEYQRNQEDNLSLIDSELDELDQLMKA